MSLTILTAYTPGTVYEEIAAENRKRCERFGYDFEAYPLTDSDDLHGSPPKATFKPRLLFQHVAAKMGGSDMGAGVVWMDADAVLIRPLGDPFRGFDAFVTLRDVGELGVYTPETSYLNSGIVGARVTPGGIAFAAKWLQSLSGDRGDQMALNCVFGEEPSVDTRAYHQSFWRSVSIAGAAQYLGPLCAKVHPCRTHNFFYWPEEPGPHCKALHFKHGILAAKPKGWWRDEVKRFG